MCEDFKIQHHNSTPYRPKMNGAVEAAKKNIKKIVQKMTVSYKDWAFKKKREKKRKNESEQNKENNKKEDK